MKIILDHLMKKRNEQVVYYINKAIDILELGCGTAPIINILKKDQKYTGVDLNKKVISKLKNKFPNHTFFKIDISKEKVTSKEKFDLILLVAFIEHLKNPDFLLENINKNLKNNGRIVMTTPTKLGDLLNTIGAYIGLTAMSAVIDHEIIYNKKKVKYLCERNNLKLICYKKFQFGLNQLIVIGNKK